jgi:glutamate-1-semialdehyde 2,1-aminomutase
LAAAKATLKKLQQRPILQSLANRGEIVIARTREIIQKHDLGDVFAISGHPSWSFLSIKDARLHTAYEIKTFWMQELHQHGILSTGTHNMSFAHSPEDIEMLIQVYTDLLPTIGRLLDAGELRRATRCAPLVPLFKLR